MMRIMFRAVCATALALAADAVPVGAGSARAAESGTGPRRTIVIGGDYDYPPYEFLDANGEPAGYCVALTRAIARQTGMEVEIRLGPWEEVRAALAAGELDAVQGMFYSLERERECDFSPPHTAVEHVAVVRRDGGPPPEDAAGMAGMRIAVMAGDIMHDWALRNGLEQQLVTTPTQASALKQVVLGRCDCALTARLPALFWIRKHGWDNLAAGSRSLLTPDYCYAVPHGDMALLARLTDGLRILHDSGEYQRIHREHLGVLHGEFIRLGTILRYTALIALPLLLLLCTALLWSRALRREVTRQTSAVRRSEQRLEHVNRVLGAIRNVNQLITQEEDPERLLHGACRLLVETRGFHNAWIVLVRHGRPAEPFFHAGLDNTFEPMAERLRCGDLPRCARAAMASPGVHAVSDPPRDCDDCPFGAAYRGRSGLAVRLEHAQRVFGWLTVSLPARYAEDAEERALLAEVAGDVAFALWSLEAEQQRRSAEREYADMLASTSDAVIAADLSGTITLFNAGAQRLLGCTPEEAVGSPIARFCPQERQQEQAGLMRRVKEAGSLSGVETERLHADGRRVPCEMTLTVRRDEQGNPVRLGAILRDITERKRVEAEREITLQLLRRLNRANDVRGLMKEVSLLMGDWSGCEAVGVRLREGDLFPLSGTRGFPADFVQARERPCPAGSGAASCDAPRNPASDCICGRVLRRAFDPSQPYVTEHGTFWTNHFSELCASGSLPAGLSRNRCRDQGYESLAMVPLRHGGETLGLLQFHDSRRDRFDPGRIALLERLASNLALALAQRHAQQALRESERKHRAYIEHAPVGIFITDREGCYVDVNPAACQMTGYTRTELLALRVSDIVDPDVVPEVMRAFGRLADSGALDDELRLRHKNGSDVDVSLRAVKLSDGRFMGFCSDISARKRAERHEREMAEKLTEAERRESLGVLAGGVAHDLNNILGPIVLLPEMVEEVLRKAPALEQADIESAREDLRVIADSARRAAATINDLRTLGRRGRMALQPVDANRLVSDCLKTHDITALRSEHPDVALDVRLSPRPLWIEADGTAMHRVLLNLVLNAMEATPAPGRVQVEVTREILREPKLGYEIVDPGDYAVLHVRDTGTGIPESLVNRIFEPFVTNKKGTGGKGGSGLGLSVVYAMVKDHSGYIDLHRGEQDWSTRFSLYLPLSDASADAAAGSRDGSKRMPRGREHVLVVDDEPGQRFIARRTLTSLGYTVTEAASGQDAVELFEQVWRAEAPAPFHLVLLDMVMQENFGGFETLRRIRRMYPRQKAVIVSGNATEMRPDAARPERLEASWLTKPYEAHQLACAVRACLDREAGKNRSP